jgi:hypothetical protein
MIHPRVALLAMAAFVLSGCSTTTLKGEIQNDIYTAQDKSFSVTVPHKNGSYEHDYIQVREQYLERGAYVSFGSADLDKNFYRIQTIKRNFTANGGVSFDESARIVVNGYKAQILRSFGSTPQELESRPETVNGRQAHYWKLTQVVPAGTFFDNKSMIFTHEVYVIDFYKSVAMIWVVIPDTAKQAAMDPRVFAESLVMY